MMKSALLTSSQAARLLNVHESSIKRWSGEGLLEFDKTKGGHRRILLNSLLEFAHRKEMQASLLDFGPYQHEVGLAALACRERNDFGPFANLALRLCREGPSQYLALFFQYLRVEMEISLARIFDSGIGLALREVGDEWESGRLSVAHEHRYSQRFFDAMHFLRLSLPPPSTKPSGKALVGCAEGCQHEFGALFCRMILEEMGWEVFYLGQNVPFEEYATLQEEQKADLICISFVPPLSSHDARRCTKILSALYKAQAPYSLCLGGHGLQGAVLEDETFPFHRLKLAGSVQGFRQWVISSFPMLSDGVQVEKQEV